MGLKIVCTLTGIDGAPGEFQIFPFGEIQIDGEAPANLDPAAMDAIIADFLRRGNDMVIDYEHQTLQDVQAPAAGWIKNLVNRGQEGLWAVVEWTKQAKAYLENKEYRYFSPVFWVADAGRRIVKIEHVALTNYPRINNLRPIMAKMSLDAQEYTNNEKEENQMNEKLKEVLGLAKEVGEDQVIAAAEALAAKAKTPEVREVVPKDVLVTLGLKDTDGLSAVVASIHAIQQSAKGAVSREEFEKIQKDLRQRDASEVVAKAMTEGKITPDQREWATQYAERDLEGFKIFAAKAPVVIPVGSLPGQTEKKDTAIVTDAVLTVAKLFGNTPEDIRKYGAR
jgi:phage I-like protein